MWKNFPSLIITDQVLLNAVINVIGRKIGVIESFFCLYNHIFAINTNSRLIMLNAFTHCHTLILNTSISAKKLVGTILPFCLPSSEFWRLHWLSKLLAFPDCLLVQGLAFSTRADVCKFGWPLLFSKFCLHLLKLFYCNLNFLKRWKLFHILDSISFSLK